MDFKRCPDCSGVIESGAEHRCPKTVQFSLESSRICPACGAEFKGETHEDCTRARTHVLSPGQDETPAEVRPLLDQSAMRVFQYVLVARLGRGGMGDVWKAWDTRLTRWIAIKFLTLTEEDGRRRFEREAKLAARLRHPNIAAVFEVGEHSGRHYIAMEFIDGMTLEQAKPPPRLAAEIVAKVARALHAAHEAGVIHRDIKPSNVMVARDQWPYVMDFGLARSIRVDSSISVAGDIMGTPAFMSPEQARGRPSEVDARSDVYSLGATLYATLARRPPYAGEGPMDIVLNVLLGKLTPPREHDPKIPPALEAIVLKAMAPARENRYATALDVALDLERFLADEDVSARPPTTVRKVVKRVRRHLWPIAVLGLAAVVAAWMLRPPSSPVAADLAIPDTRPDFGRLAYHRFDPGDPEPVPRMRAPGPEAIRWFRGEARLARKDADDWGARRDEWLKLKEPARRLVRWCEAVEAILAGHDDDLVREVAAIRASVRPVIAYAGRFTLRILVRSFPTARIRTETIETPCALTLDVDDYEIEIVHGPRTKKVALNRKALRDGGVCWIRGDMDGPEPLRVSQ
ncbi:MAG: protein kinase [Planctomycetes bacterium]|nr:protein kinase [Planctomycetota bacterium]